MDDSEKSFPDPWVYLKLNDAKIHPDPLPDTWLLAGPGWGEGIS